MPHTFDFAGLTLTVTIETDPPVEGFDPVSPGQGAGGLYEWRTEVTCPRCRKPAPGLVPAPAATAPPSRS